MDIFKQTALFKEETIALRRHMHQNPELSGKEFATTELIIKELEKLGIEYIRPAETGVIAIIKGRDNGRVLGLRADIDALPVEEETGLEFSSVNHGVMHACGHDAHTASLMETVKILNLHKDELNGTVKFIFQPSEEFLPSGAEKMVDSGELNDCSAIVGIHVKSDMPVGKISVEPGPRMAASAGVDIKVKGKSGHAGIPSDSVDATVAAAAIVMNLQTVVSRELSLDNMAVLSIGTLNSGTARNVISGEAVLEGTCRYYSDEAIEHVIKAVERIAKCTAGSFRAEAEVSVVPSGCKAVINDSKLAAEGAKTAEKIFGKEALCHYPISGLNEDFSKYSTICPLLYVLIGAQNDSKFEPYPLHSSKLQIDEDCMDYAAAFMAQFALDYLAQDL